MKSFASRLPRDFRKLPLAERIATLKNLVGHWEAPPPELTEALVETSVGWFEVPLGIVVGLPLDEGSVDVPLAVEEPSVIAAATYAARLFSGGKVTSWATQAVMTAQVWLEAPADVEFETADAELVTQTLAQKFEAGREALTQVARKGLASMEKRGGGLRDLRLRAVEGKPPLWVAEADVEVCDAMGANLLNTLAEALAPELEQHLGLRRLMAILSNDASHRRAGATVGLKVTALNKPSLPGAEAARRIALASAAAQRDPGRAVTNNKGVMNGVTSLALATGNDTRALEASVHCWASRAGVYRPLTTWSMNGDTLTGVIELPVPLGTVGGALMHPRARDALTLLGNPSAHDLARIAAVLGLAQNFAALFALTGEGIQRGHMALHQRRLDFEKGHR